MGLTVPNGFSITGIVKFHEVSLSEVEAEREEECSLEGLVLPDPCWNTTYSPSGTHSARRRVRRMDSIEVSGNN